MRRSRTVWVEWRPEVLRLVAVIGGKNAWFQVRIVASVSFGFEVRTLMVFMFRMVEWLSFAMISLMADLVNQ